MKKIIDPLFDGHLEKPIKLMTAKEKLIFLSKYIEFYHSAKSKIKKVKK